MLDTSLTLGEDIVPVNSLTYDIESDICPICLVEVTTLLEETTDGQDPVLVRTTCGHVFCHCCLEELVRYNYPRTGNNLIYNYDNINNYYDNINNYYINNINYNDINDIIDINNTIDNIIDINNVNNIINLINTYYLDLDDSDFVLEN